MADTSQPRLREDMPASSVWRKPVGIFSPAVSAQRQTRDAPTELDYFPTPEWGTRTLIEFLSQRHDLSAASCLEPAAGGGHMSDVLGEAFGSVVSRDIEDHENRGWEISDFLSAEEPAVPYDWVITNPPFRLADEFAAAGPRHARNMALLCRLQFLEGKRRHSSVFSSMPMNYVLVFTERLAMLKGRIDASASGNVAYGWFVWENIDMKDRPVSPPQIFWIEPGARTRLASGVQPMF